jgi:hypothetical protein
MTRGLLSQIANLVLFMTLQILFLRNVVLFDYAFCFIYIGFLLFIPFEFGAIPLLITAFITGLFVDIFYDSLGIHAFSMVLAGFIRPFWINGITPRGGYEQGALPNINSMCLQWYLLYALPIVFIHHLTLFTIERGNFTLFHLTLLKAFSSTLFTFILLVVFQYLFKQQRRM